jgi:hypothetical protein
MGKRRGRPRTEAEKLDSLAESVRYHFAKMGWGQPPEWARETDNG